MTSVPGLKVCKGEGPYPPVNIVVLGFLVESSVRSPPVDHAAAHRDGGSHNMLDEFWLARMAHGIDAALGEGQVNGLCKVERRRRGIPKICCKT